VNAQTCPQVNLALTFEVEQTLIVSKIDYMNVKGIDIINKKFVNLETILITTKN